MLFMYDSYMYKYTTSPSFLRQPSYHILHHLMGSGMKSRMREDRMIPVTKIHKIEYSKSRKIAKSNDHNSEIS